MKSLTPGVWPQIYRGAIPGDILAQHKAMDAALAEFKALGCPGVAFHGFSSELPERWEALAQHATNHGLQALAAFGMDDTGPATKGLRIGTIAARKDCAGVVLDAEGAWEHLGDRDKAVVLGHALREVAPDALVLDQPWPVPTMHSSFPLAEFGEFVDYRCPQLYVNDWKRQFGHVRYAKCMAWFDASWKSVESYWSPEQRKPRLPTIQGYGWDDILPDLVDCLCRNPTVLMWCEPFPTDAAKRAMRAVQALASHGCTGPDAVKTFQDSAGLTADNRCGPLTLAKLGL